ncbi:hypothetical protein NW759_005648 [Fusarium solani]|nr:hypothetical protein NW759_005648 [Fusarium solani]
MSLPSLSVIHQSRPVLSCPSSIHPIPSLPISSLCGWPKTKQDPSQPLAHSRTLPLSRWLFSHVLPQVTPTPMLKSFSSSSPSSPASVTFTRVRLVCNFPFPFFTIRHYYHASFRRLLSPSSYFDPVLGLLR